VKFQPPENDLKNHGPVTIRMPTCDGGRNVTYSDTIVRWWRDRVQVRTPLAAAVAPSSRRCSRTNGSHA
jgi:hypothetical protein